MATAPATKAPTHLWIIGILALLFNAMGALDYLMMRFKVDIYMAQLTEDMLAWYDSFPIWMEIAWPVSVWAAVIGCVLLLMRKSSAVTAFAVSTIAYLVAAVHSFGTNPPPAELATPGSMIFSIFIGVQLALLWYYARRMTAMGVLS
ncbi:hypothetical protein [Sphingomicrobium clamense]|uniref:DoxX family protein n=1 Tax=Sphingomicrobium clamense TaxID=2851013 RepID=A0ABS6V3X8_9SPHN|nr:hypothetical protein [Sphingomicrobium sp. B8]MBW0144249.1 hypothetical protein [Sphingomicrobium sp. B8]